MVQSKENAGEQARYGTHAELLLAFWASIGFKPGDFHDQRHEREACCVALPRLKQSDAPSMAHAL
jgi:hypothetical protein